MSVSLAKGSNVSLSKAAPAMKKVLFGLGWNPRTTDGVDFDLDASAFLLGSNNKVRKDEDFIFYNNATSSEGSVKHTGDNKTGSGDGDDESLHIDLTLIPADVVKVVFTVTIHEAQERKQNFGQVGGAYIRIADLQQFASNGMANSEGQEEKVNVEVARYDLTEDASTETAMIFGELYRHNDEWKFRAVGQGFAGGLKSLCAEYGINAN